MSNRIGLTCTLSISFDIGFPLAWKELLQIMKKLLIIGIGAGNPEYVTIQAVNALNEVDVFFVMDKGTAKEKLIALRKEIIERYVKDRDYRIVTWNRHREVGVLGLPRDSAQLPHQDCALRCHET